VRLYAKRGVGESAARPLVTVSLHPLHALGRQAGIQLPLYKPQCMKAVCNNGCCHVLRANARSNYDDNVRTP
jgi:hypothetical protein